MAQALTIPNAAVLALSAEAVAKDFNLPFAWVYDLKDDRRAALEYPGVHPPVRVASAAVRYFLRESPAVSKLPDMIDFLLSDYMKSLVAYLENGQREPTDEEINIAVQTILNRPHQNGIDPKLWLFDYTDIIKELGCSVAAIDAVRRCLRDTAVFAPTPAEFRTSLIEASNTINKLISDINLLATKPAEGLERIDETVQLLMDGATEQGDEELRRLQSIRQLCYTKIDGGQQQIEDSHAREEAVDHFAKDAGD
jgi:hypothetical protein